MSEEKKAFNNWKHNAIQLTFPNGNSISTIWGSCTYSDNHNDFEGFMEWKESNTCEVMILNSSEKLKKRLHKKFDGYGSVIGYLSITDWLYIVNALAKESNGD